MNTQQQKPAITPLTVTLWSVAAWFALVYGLTLVLS